MFAYGLAWEPGQVKRPRSMLGLEGERGDNIHLTRSLRRVQAEASASRHRTVTTRQAQPASTPVHPLSRSSTQVGRSPLGRSPAYAHRDAWRDVYARGHTSLRPPTAPTVADVLHHGSGVPLQSRPVTAFLRRQAAIVNGPPGVRGSLVPPDPLPRLPRRDVPNGLPRAADLHDLMDRPTALRTLRGHPQAHTKADIVPVGEAPKCHCGQPGRECGSGRG